MTKKKKPTKKKASKPMLTADQRRAEKLSRVAHEILDKKIVPADLTLDEAIIVLATVVKAIVVANTDDDDLEERSDMIEWVEQRFVEELVDIDPLTECPHAWLISPQGLITEPIGIFWSGLHADDSVRVILGLELEAFRNDISAKKELDAHVHVIEGVEGVAMIDPDWNGEPTVACANPECDNVHDVHLLVAESLFEQAKERERSAPN